MLPSGRLYLNPNDVYRDRRAKRRAKWLVDDVWCQVEKAPELGNLPGKCSGREEKPEDAWPLVAEVAASHPRLLAWLSEGRVNWHWNVFGFWIGVLRACPGLGEVMWHFLFKPVARRAPWRLELREALLQEERQKRNHELMDSRLSTTLTIADTPGLSAMTDVAMIMPTEALHKVHTKIERMSSGCVGVSGLRGAGKSAVIRDFCCQRYGTPTWHQPPPKDTWSDSPSTDSTKRTEPDKPTALPGLRFMMQASLAYDAREFLIHLYTCLCRTVLADVRLNPTSFARHVLSPLPLPRPLRVGRVLRGLSVIALLVAAGVLAYRAATGGWPAPSWPVGNWAVLGAVAATLAAMIILSWRTREALIEVRQIITLAADAQRRLERLHFQRTDTLSRGGALNGPMGTGVNLTSSHALVEQMMTLPEIIDDYRDFAERVVAAIQQASGSGESQANVRLVIGIDEMDQIEDAGEAHKLLNELSAVFGIPHCVYLIAVSPDTLAVTNQRTVPLKTSSGGLFDEMVWVEPLDLAGAGDLLDRRVIGLPAAYIALCYVLSGGLPRDLLRVARAIFTGASVGTRIGLAKVARDVITDEIVALRRRALAHAASLDIPALPDLQGLLSDENQPIDIDTVLERFHQLRAENAQQWFAAFDKMVASRAAEVCDSFLAGLYFLLTVYQLFTGEHKVVTDLATRSVQGICKFRDDPALRNLAYARTALSVDPSRACTIIYCAREALHREKGVEFAADLTPPFLNHMKGQQIEPRKVS
jgi:hypothetical protein